MVNRKLIRPSLSEIKDQRPITGHFILIRPSLSEIKDQMPRYGPLPRKRVPPEVTNAENYYYIKQMAAKTPMIVKLTDGEEIRGVIEWYDKNCIKGHRNDGPTSSVWINL